jgi:quercetin dioxygenase-like cupin family protein
MKTGATSNVDLGDLLALPGAGAIYTAGGEFCFQPVGAGNGLRSFVRRSTLSNSYWCLNQLVSWLATGRDTGGALSLMELSGRQGVEPPPHVHTREDEVYFVLDGEATFHRGGEVMHAGPGDAIYLPRGIRHWHTVRTQRWRTLVATAPAGIENYYLDFSRPARRLEPPSPAEDPIDFAATLPRLVEVGERYGIWYPPAR